MLQKSRGIVLKIIPFSDRQKIARIFTEDFGARSMLFGTGGKTGKAMLALLQPLQHCELIFFSKPEGIDALRQASSAHVYTHLTHDPIKRLQAMFMSEVLYRCLHHHGEDSELYLFTLDSLCSFDAGNGVQPDEHIHWLLELSRRMGFYPEDNFDEQRRYFNPSEGVFVSGSQGRLSPVYSEQESRLFHMLLSEGMLPPLNREERSRLLALIIALFAAHVPGWKDLKSPEILAEIIR